MSRIMGACLCLLLTGLSAAGQDATALVQYVAATTTTYPYMLYDHGAGDLVGDEFTIVGDTPVYDLANDRVYLAEPGSVTTINCAGESLNGPLYLNGLNALETVIVGNSGCSVHVPTNVTTLTYWSGYNITYANTSLDLSGNSGLTTVYAQDSNLTGLRLATTSADNVNISYCSGFSQLAQNYLLSDITDNGVLGGTLDMTGTGPVDYDGETMISFLVSDMYWTVYYDPPA